MAFLSALDISLSALTAQRMRMDIVAENFANANTTRTENGGTYRRKVVTFREGQQNFSELLRRTRSQYTIGGVEVDRIMEDPSPFKLVYDPSHPDADANGYVSLPNVDTLKETMEMISATRSYEANITALNAIKGMAQKALEIGR